MILAQDTKIKPFGNDSDYTRYIRFAKVIEVFDSLEPGQEENYGKVSLMWLDTLAMVNGPVSYLKTCYSSSFGYGLLIIPSVGDIAACYSVSGAQPIILGFLSRNQFYSAKARLDNTDDVSYVSGLKSGEILLKGKAQSSILFHNDGKIDISIKNGKNTTAVVNEDQRKNATKFQNRVSDEYQNEVLRISLGLSDALAGPGRQVISCTTGEAKIQTFELIGQQGVLSYSLGSLTNIEVLAIDSVLIYVVNSNGTRSLKKTLDKNSKVKIAQTYYYTTGITNEISEENACTMDSNGVITAITLPSNVSGLLNNKNTLIQVNLLVRNPNFSCKVNEFGDLILNCRNAVINAQDGKSQFGVFADSRIVANAVKTELGNRLTGFVCTDRGGVQVSAGTFENAVVEHIEPENALSVVGDAFYFYVLDSFPLICYAEGKYHLVGVEEYKSLTKFDRDNIMCKAFDYTYGASETDGFTRTKLDALMKEAYDKKEPLISYGELKML